MKSSCADYIILGKIFHNGLNSRKYLSIHTRITQFACVCMRACVNLIFAVSEKIVKTFRTLVISVLSALAIE